MSNLIINNLSSTNNHSQRLKELFSESESILMISPFLMRDFADFLGEINCKKIKNIHLVTTLQPKSFDQINKISSIVSLIEFPDIKESKIECKVSINNRLHGKIYIFKSDSKYISAIITSANFTENGLFRNHEWGIEINNQEEIKNLEKSILDNLEYENISKDEILQLRTAADEFLNKEPQTENREISLSLTGLLNRTIKISDLDEGVSYWLKPIGVTEYPIGEGELYSQPQFNLHFSKFRPNGVKPNDILIAYGVGTRKVLSIYKAISFPLHATKEESEKKDWLKRWPWYVKGENLTPKYGGNWWKSDFYISKLVSDYLRFFPDSHITAVGGKTIGGLNFGKDKLNLDYNFAKFIIEKVFEKNK
jgi:HKD family nuclease